MPPRLTSTFLYYHINIILQPIKSYSYFWNLTPIPAQKYRHKNPDKEWHQFYEKSHYVRLFHWWPFKNKNMKSPCWIRTSVFGLKGHYPNHTRRRGLLAVPTEYYCAEIELIRYILIKWQNSQTEISYHTKFSIIYKITTQRN